jgi:hypothetical protein
LPFTVGEWGAAKRLITRIAEDECFKIKKIIKLVDSGAIKRIDSNSHFGFKPSLPGKRAGTKQTWVRKIS